MCVNCGDFVSKCVLRLRFEDFGDGFSKKIAWRQSMALCGVLIAQHVAPVAVLDGNNYGGGVDDLL